MAGSYLAGRDYSARLHLYPLNVFYNIYLAADRYKATADYPQTSAGFRFNAVPTHAASGREVYVLVIGETARAYSFGLYGYGRNTTPMLQRTGGLTVFSDAITQSNTTHKSVPMLKTTAAYTARKASSRRSARQASTRHSYQTSGLTTRLLTSSARRPTTGSL